MSKATTAERALNRKGGTMSRLIKTLFGFYPVLLPLVVAGVVLCAIINSIGATFLQSALQIISESWQSGDWEAARPKILQLVTTLACIYGVGVLSSLFWNRAMAIVTQGSLEKLREMMFNRMQDLPIRYFDTHQRGDTMSHYTNDIDTLRQMISQSLPNLLMTIIIIVTVFFIMLYYSVWMCLVIIAGVVFMTFMTKLLGSNSARFFIAQQTELGVVEGHIEEVMNGQKVVKAFCHESAAEADFDERNEKLFEVSQKANMYANILMPILMNLGNLLYVLVALAGGIFLALGVPNLSISGMALSISVVVPFLNMTKQFCGQIGLRDARQRAGEPRDLGVRGGGPPHRHVGVETSAPRNRRDRVRTAARRPGHGQRRLWLHARPRGAARRVRVCQAGPEGRVCRRHRCRQDDHHQPHQPLLRGR